MRVSSLLDPFLSGRARSHPLIRIYVSIASLLSLAACSTTHYHQSADKEVYAIIDEKTSQFPEVLPEFTIDPTGPVDLEGFPISSGRYEYLGPEADAEVDAYVINLEDALEIGFLHSREFQNRKESFYLAGLSLSLDRYNFAPIFGAGIGASVGGDTNGVVSGEADSSLRLDRLAKSGSRLAFDLTTSFLQFISGDPRRSVSSVLSGSLTQPLLKGRGRKVAAESLTQAERGVLYELRDFARFRKTFVVRVESEYYRVLSARDAVRNNYRGIESFRVSLERERAFAEEGLSTPAAVGRLEQAELSRQSSWINSIRSYKQALDNFKILLGLSTDTPLVLDETELEVLRVAGIHPELSSEDAVDIGLATRLDLRTTEDRVADAQRRVGVSANALQPGLDLFVTADVDSKSGNRPFSPDFNDPRWSAGVDVELPFDRKAERNAYRRSLIDYERAARDFDLRTDQVKFEIREGWRALDQARRNYDINLKGVELNERRVEEQNLRAELGLGNVLDQVDAQNDLTNAQNQLTGQLVSHSIAKLEFWRDIGILKVLENGQWEETLNVGEQSD